ncbi:hypothetical protein [Amycolatopsis sp. CB00013]|uniref:hypothetical protein n=1 Tax=Amycolatopsis sp. CB00013 TaxID=1703945 RepID=UPI000939C1C1|nr:hypothetical protein [Amycolatopsis sp. CB00013]
MTEDTHSPSDELPPYHAVLSVDVKNFSGVTPADHYALTELIPTILERAFERSGHAAVWADRRFPAGRGDGFVVGFRPETLPILVGSFLDALQDELAYHHRLRLGQSGEPTRLRVSVAVGPLIDSGNARLGDGSGAAMIETHRLLDCEPVRMLLASSEPEVTFVAAVLSARVYEDVVLCGYTTKAPAEFVRVPVSVKNYVGDAYLHVPKPSGDLLARGIGTRDELVPEDSASTDEAPEAESAVTNTINGTVHGNAIQMRDQNRWTDKSRHSHQHTTGDGNIVTGGSVSGGIRQHVRKNGKKD